MTRIPQEHAGGTSHPLAPPAVDPAPEADPSSGAGCGQAVPTPAAPVAGPVAGTTGPASASPSEPPPPGSGGASGERGPRHLAAPPRNAPAVSPPVGGRGTSTSVGPEQGPGPAATSPPVQGSGGAEGGEPALRRRTPGVGSPTDTSPAGDRRLNAASPAAPPLRDQAFRDAWKAARSEQAKDQRRRRGGKPRPVASPGVGRLRVAPPRPESFDAPPPPSIRIKHPPEPPEAAL